MGGRKDPPSLKQFDGLCVSDTLCNNPRFIRTDIYYPRASLPSVSATCLWCSSRYISFIFYIISACFGSEKKEFHYEDTYFSIVCMTVKISLTLM